MKKSFHLKYLSRASLLGLAACLATGNRAQAQNGVWTNPAGGSYANPANWQGGNVAQGTDSTADFSTLTLGADATVTLDGAQSIGNLLFGDLGSAHNWFLNTGTGDPLTLTTSSGAPAVTVNNQTATIGLALAGTAGLTLNGNGTLVLGQPAGYAGPTTVNGGTLRLLGSLVTLKNSPLTINAGVAESAATLNFDVKQSGSASSPDVVGAGTLRLIGTTNGPTHPDIYFGPDHSGTSYYGAKSQVATLDLGAAQRYIFAKSGHNSVARYRNNEDARLETSIIGSGGITYIAQNNFGGSTPMEVPMVWAGANTFTGLVEIQRGSIYLFNAQALVQTNKLLLDPLAGNNARLFLYGNNSSVLNLESAGAGNALVANGNVNNNVAAIPAATLTVLQTSNTVFAGALVDSQYEYDAGSFKSGPLSLTLNGTGTLTLTGTNFYSGATLVNGGKLVIPALQKGGSAFTLADGTALGIGGAGAGTVAMSALTLGNAGATTLELAFSASPSATVAPVTVTNLTANGGAGAVTVNVNINGGISVGQFPLVKYVSGVIGGSGYAAFHLGSLPGYLTASLVNNSANSSIDLLVTAVASPEWSGKLSSEWSTNKLAAPKNWVFITDGVSPTDYNPGNAVLFNDVASGITTVDVSVADVAPAAVTFDNSVNNYTVTGSKAITGPTGLIKTGSGLLALRNANTFTGPVNIGGGVVAINADANLGAVPAVPTPAAVVINGGTLAAVTSVTLATNRGLALGPIAGGGNGTVDVTNSAVLVVNGTVANNGSSSSALYKTGAGQLVLATPGTYNAGTFANAGTLTLRSTWNFARGNLLTIASNAVTESAGLLNLVVDTTSTLSDVTGGGLLRLTSTNSSAASPDLYFGPNHSGNADWGTRIATALDLGNAQRFVFGRTGHNGVGQYGLTGGDCQFGGPISGSGGLTLIAQNTYTGSPLMEVPFCFNASNSFTGPVELQRGSIYLGAPGAFPAGNVLTLNPASGNNARFFLYGNSITVSDLSATNAGASVIADGNVNPEKIGPATLTVIQNHSLSFNGSLVDVQAEYGGGGSLTPTLSLTKSGPATLTLNGVNTFTGPTAITAGTLALGATGTLDATPAITLAPGGVLDVSASAFILGSTIPQTLVGGRSSNFGPDIIGPFSSVGAIDVAGGGVAGTLTVSGDLNLQGGNLFLDLAASSTAGAGVNDLIIVTGALNLGGPVTLTPNFLSGHLASGTYTLIRAAAFNGDPNNLHLVLPAGGRQNYTLDTTTVPGSVLLQVSGAQPASLVWLGTNSSVWAGSVVNWRNGAVADAFYNGDFTTFNDSATNGLVDVEGSVQPFSIQVTNNNTSYAFVGGGSIDGPTALTKSGNGKLVVLNANTYVGATLINGGTLQVDTNGATGSLGAGPVTNNATLAFDRNDVFAVSNNIAGSGLVRQLGSGTALFLGANTYSGPTVIAGGALQVGNDANYGSLGSGPVTNNGVLAFARNDTVAVPNLITGTGVVTNFDGHVTFKGASSYHGGTFIEGGTLVAANPTALGTGPVTIDNGALYFNFPSGSTNVVANDIVLPGFGAQEFLIEGNPTTWTTVRLTGVISGGALGQSFRLADTGVGGNHYDVLVLDNPSNTFGGDIQLWRGTLGFTSDAALGDPANNIEIDLWSLNGSFRFDADNITLSPSRTITLDSGGVEPINVQGFTGTIPGVITGPGPFVKQGAGTLILNGDNTYTSTTEITAGTLQVNGTLESIGLVTVDANGTLAGTGTLLGPVTVNGKIAPGSNSVGTLTTGAEQWNTNSTLVFSLNNATNSAGWSLVSITDGLDLEAQGGAPITIKVVTLTPANTPGLLAGFNPGVSQSWPLVVTVSGITNFSAAEFQVDTSGFLSPLSGVFSVTTNGNSLVLVYTHIAQPPALAGGAFQANGSFRLSLTGSVGATFTVHATTDLNLRPYSAWPVVGTGALGAGVTTFDDHTASNHVDRFYLITTP